MSWSKNKTDSANVNNGNEYANGDSITPSQINACFNNSFYAVDVIDNLQVDSNTVEYSDGASVEINDIENTNYKKIIFNIPRGQKGVQGIQGKSLFFNSSYNSASTYYNNDIRIDIVYYNGNSYVPKNETVSGYSPTNETYWSLFCSKGADGLGGNITANNLLNIETGKIYALKNVAVLNNVLTAELVEIPSAEDISSMKSDIEDLKLNKIDNQGSKITTTSLISLASIKSLKNGVYTVENGVEGLNGTYFTLLINYDSNGNGIVFAIERNTNSRIYYNVYQGSWMGWIDIAKKSEVDAISPPTFTATITGAANATKEKLEVSYTVYLGNGVCVNRIISNSSSNSNISSTWTPDVYSSSLKGTIKFTYLPYSYNGTITLVLQDVFGRRKTVEIPCNYNW